MKLPPPASEQQLQQRANELAGKTLGEVARIWGTTPPSTLNHAKGWVGQLIEKALGANGHNLDQPDFVNLGVELKTLPITSNGQPCESTYICMASIPNQDEHWEHSRVWRKMAKVLWVPIEANSQKPLAAQRIGTPILWSPPQHIVLQLRQDWEELTELITLGHFDQLSATKGKYLQIRPKAANAKTFVRVINHQGQLISVIPKGFYLRAKLTQQIVLDHYVLP